MVVLKKTAEAALAADPINKAIIFKHFHASPKIRPRESIYIAAMANQSPKSTWVMESLTPIIYKAMMFLSLFTEPVLSGLK